MAKKKSKNKIIVREFVQVEHKYDQAERNAAAPEESAGEPAPE